MTKPIIGITLDFEDNKKYSHAPYYALRENYIESVKSAGGVPILLPFNLEGIDKIIDTIDALIITGGHFDISPELYGLAGDEKVHNEVRLKENRTEFEWQITQKAIAKKIPILGICGGMQLLNVILGGDLIQHIPDEVENFIAHEQKPIPYDQAAHDIEIETDTLLFNLAEQKEIIGTNTSHHQAVKNIAPGFVISAKTKDGVIEAIEKKDYPFMIGVQWHPEYQVSQLDENLFKALIESAKK